MTSLLLIVPMPLARAAVCLAQAEAANGAQRPDLPFALQYLPLLAIAAAAYLLLFRPERERMRKQQDVLKALKRNDRVVTSSGIYGTVANARNLRFSRNFVPYANQPADISGALDGTRASA